MQDRMDREMPAQRCRGHRLASSRSVVRVFDSLIRAACTMTLHHLRGQLSLLEDGTDLALARPNSPPS